MKHRFFTVLVVGEDPDKLMEKYKITNNATLTLKYRYSDRQQIKNKMLEYIDASIKFSKGDAKAMLETQYNFIKNLTPEEYFQVISEGCTYDEDGNAFTSENLDGKYDYYQKSNHFSIPFVTTDEKEVMSAQNDEIDWSKLHKKDAHVYERVWEMVIEGQKPQDKEEATWYNNMSEHKAYLEKFKDKDSYVRYCSSYWAYAYLDENGWKDASESDMEEWVDNFYDKYIVPLKPSDKLTLFEYTIPLDV